MKRIGVVIVAGCGGAAPAPVPSNQATTSTDARVYAWDTYELVGLYCNAGAGLAAIDGCAWPDTLPLPFEPPLVAQHRAHRRPDIEGTPQLVHGYGARFPGAAPILVVQSEAGVTMWTAPLGVEPYGEHTMPDAPPVRVVDASGVPSFVVVRTGVADDGRPPVVVDLSVDGRAVSVDSYIMPIVPAALDLDRDGRPEVIHLGSDDGGGYVEALEVTDTPDQDGFRARSGG